MVEESDDMFLPWRRGTTVKRVDSAFLGYGGGTRKRLGHETAAILFRHKTEYVPNRVHAVQNAFQGNTNGLEHSLNLRDRNSIPEHLPLP